MAKSLQAASRRFQGVWRASPAIPPDIVLENFHHHYGSFAGHIVARAFRSAQWGTPTASRRLDTEKRRVAGKALARRSKVVQH